MPFSRHVARQEVELRPAEDLHIIARSMSRSGGIAERTKRVVLPPVFATEGQRWGIEAVFRELPGACIASRRRRGAETHEQPGGGYRCGRQTPGR